MRRAKYICFEGTDGVGKTTQLKLLAEYLRGLGFKVMETKAFGAQQSEVSQEIRKIMLDAKWDMPDIAREYLAQAMTAICLQDVVYPVRYDYDFILQDRGVLSNLSYSQANRISSTIGEQLARYSNEGRVHDLYDCIIYLRGDVATALNKARGAKQEFESGDVIESRGKFFMAAVDENMQNEARKFWNVNEIQIDNKSIEQVAEDIKETIIDKFSLRSLTESR